MLSYCESEQVKEQTVWHWNDYILMVVYCQNEKGKWEGIQENIFAWVQFQG